MTVKAKELAVGQQIQVEYGDYDNWVDFQIDEIRADEKYIKVDCHTDTIHTTLVMKPEEMVEVQVLVLAKALVKMCILPVSTARY